MAGKKAAEGSVSLVQMYFYLFFKALLLVMLIKESKHTSPMVVT